MCKRLLSLLLTVLTLCSLFGCMPSGTKLYSIYCMPGASGPEIFLDTVPTADQIPNASGNSQPAEADPTREILFGGDLIPLTYEEATDDNAHPAVGYFVDCRILLFCSHQRTAVSS